MKTFRRDKLRRLVEAGKVEVIDTYHFDDMHGASRAEKTMPAAMKPADWHDRKPGICYLTEHDFTSNSGCCYYNDEAKSLITLIVHSNSNYTLRILA